MSQVRLLALVLQLGLYGLDLQQLSRNLPLSGNRFLHLTFRLVARRIGWLG